MNAKKKVTTTFDLTLTEEETAMLADLLWRVPADDPMAGFASSVRQELQGLLGVQGPARESPKQTPNDGKKSKRADPNDPPEPVDGLVPKFV